MVFRTDRTVDPSMMKAATVSEGELEQIRRVSDVVRMGHVVRIEPEQIVLERSWEAPRRPIEQYAALLGRLQ